MLGIIGEFGEVSEATANGGKTSRGSGNNECRSVIGTGYIAYSLCG